MLTLLDLSVIPPRHEHGSSALFSLEFSMLTCVYLSVTPIYLVQKYEKGIGRKSFKFIPEINFFFGVV